MNDSWTRVTNLFSRRPIASKPYKLTIDQENYDGTTDADGKVERDIPMDAQQGKLEVEGYQARRPWMFSSAEFTAHPR
jgi:hypothetical protein